MSARFKGFVVTLKEDLREEQAMDIRTAIALIQGVASVDSSVVTGDDHMNREQIRIELTERLWRALNPTLKRD